MEDLAMMKRFLFLTILLFVSLSSLAFAAGPPKMFWLEPHIGDPCYLDLKIDPGNLKITSFYIVLSLEDIDVFNGITNNVGNIVTNVDNDQKVHVFRIAGMLETGFESSTLLRIVLGDQKRDIEATFQAAELNGGPAEIGGLDVVERVINGKITFSPPLQIIFNLFGNNVNDKHFVLQMGQKLIFTASGGIPPYKWEPALTSPPTTLWNVEISKDTTAMEITPPDWVKYGVRYLGFRIVLNDSTNNVRNGRVQCTFDLFPKPGDVNLDGNVTAEDARLVLRSIVYLEGDDVLTEPQVVAADVSANGTVTTADAVLILQFSVGLISELPGALDDQGAPSVKQSPSFNKQVAELRQKGVDSETIALLTLAKQQESKGKQPITWGKIKS